MSMVLTTPKKLVKFCDQLDPKIVLTITLVGDWVKKNGVRKEMVIATKGKSN